MLRLAKNAGFDGIIIKALRKCQPGLDLIRVEEILRVANCSSPEEMERPG
jgi:hypothetical protein